MSHDWEGIIGGAVDKALRTAGMMLQGDAMRNVKTQHLVDTGRLIASVSFATDKVAATIGALAKEGDGVSTPETVYTLHVGTNVPYAQIHEFGGTIKSSSGKVRTIRARPYLRPAFEAVKGRLPYMFQQECKKALKEKLQ